MTVSTPTLDESLTDSAALNQAYLIGKANGDFTDKSVENRQDLYDAAMAYLDAYIGDFQFLTNMQAHVAKEKMLTVGMVRGILNSMMEDARQRMSAKAALKAQAENAQSKAVQPTQSQLPIPIAVIVGHAQKVRKTGRRANDKAKAEPVQPAAPRRKRSYEEIFGKDAA